MNIKKNKSSMNSGIHNVLLAHYTWKGIIKSQFWLENSVLNATTLLTIRKKIVYIMQTWWGLFLFLCNIWIGKRQASLRGHVLSNATCYILKAWFDWEQPSLVNLTSQLEFKS